MQIELEEFQNEYNFTDSYLLTIFWWSPWCPAEAILGPYGPFGGQQNPRIQQALDEQIAKIAL